MQRHGMAGERMLDVLTLMDAASESTAMPTVSAALIAAVLAGLTLVLLLRHRLTVGRRTHAARLADEADVAQAASAIAHRHRDQRLTVSRVTQAEIAASTPLETATEEAHNASTGSGKDLHRAVGAHTEVRGAARRSGGAGYTVEGRDLKEMVLIPGGDFWMGSDDKDENEKPMHKVHVETFYIDKYPVTNAEFARFVEATGYATEAEQSGKGWIWQSEWREVQGACWRRPTGAGSDIADCMDHPVVLVSWNDAREYCQWAGKRLPTEAEWEKAARGTDTRKWPWGSEWDPSRLNSGEQGHGTTTPVGSYAGGASSYGVFDMAGNVWEWVDEWYKPYPGATFKDEDFGEKYRVLRGGSWDSFGHNARCANRTRNLQRACVNVNGFRCVLSVHESDAAPSSRQREILVPMRRLGADLQPPHLETSTHRLCSKTRSDAFDRAIEPARIVEMGRAQIEVIQGRAPFLFRSGRKAHGVQELAFESLRDPSTATYHLRAGHFTQYLGGLGWRASRQAEHIARAYSPSRDLPYWLALVLEYARPLCLGMTVPPPSEELLETIVVHRGLTSLLVRRGEVFVSPRDAGEMVFIPEGAFLMGADEAHIAEALRLASKHHTNAVRAWFADEGPMRSVNVDAYLIDRCPVTNEQYDRFERATGHRSAGDWRRHFEGGRETHPVVMVSWDDACAYAAWAGKRLPTEAEWEKAARGTDGRTYAWGNRWDPARLNSLEKSPPYGTTPVGSYPEGASPYGVLDCLGNVWEWTADPYRRYPDSTHDSDRYGDHLRVFRGGSWNNYRYNNRCSNRHSEDPTYTCVSHGFRCAQTVTADIIRRPRSK